MKKFIALLMAAAMVFAMVACNSNTNTPDIDVQTPAPVDSPVTPSEPVTPDTPVDVEYVRGDDEEKYQAALGEYEELMAAAKAAPMTSALCSMPRLRPICLSLPS